MDSKTKQVSVLVEFIVEKDGPLSVVHALRDLGYNAGKEAIGVLKSLSPGEQNGIRAGSRVSLPIKNQLY